MSAAKSTRYESWGRYPKVEQTVIEPVWLPEVRIPPTDSVLAYGCGRSYGDCCLNGGGAIISTRWLNRIIEFDSQSGVLRCEAGLSFRDLLEFSLPRGWFLPVTPGTQFVTVGGAIANDVHGKNHHLSGTFGRYVRRFELLRSDGEVVLCSPDQNSDLFRATIAGLGLTGFIRWAEFQMKPVKGPFIEMESIKFGSLDEFFEITRSSDKDFEYTVAWLDCVSSGGEFGRGIFMRGNHSEVAAPPGSKGKKPLVSVPLDAPDFALSNLTVRAFNTLYYNKQFEKVKRTRSRYEPFFYPLDSVHQWNKIYGKRGFFQFQCVVPEKENNKAIREILSAIVASGKGSFLAVLKEFGEIESPGMLSFPRPGITLCLDFPNEGASTLELMRRLDTMTREAGGAMYPAKDAAMSPESFKRYFPRLEEFKKFKDPRFSSSLWRRLTE